MEYQCYEKIDDNFILKHIKNDRILLKKYDKFKLRAEIINNPNKKQCPQPNCESFLQKNEKNDFVKCQKGHKFCFECLRPWHKGVSCENIMEKEFLKWKKNKVIKKCPRCKVYTEKNEGCNHMTCPHCQFQWCWLCERQYSYGHYTQGKCNGLQFVRANYINEARRVEPRNNINYIENLSECCKICCCAINFAIILSFLFFILIVCFSSLIN